MANIIFKNIKEGEVLNFNIVLYQPEIPQNTGNIARTCVLTDCKLHLIKPLGFDINEKQVKRAGLDYWSELNLEIHESYEDFLEKYGNETIFLEQLMKLEHIMMKLNLNLEILLCLEEKLVVFLKIFTIDIKV